jgi:molybdopterin converting factor small subunit
MKTATTFTVSIKYFSILAQIVSKRSEMYELESGATLKHLLDSLLATYPEIQPYVPFIRFAVNQEYRELDFVLSENDEIALITPVSGG